MTPVRRGWSSDVVTVGSRQASWTTGSLVSRPEKKGGTAVSLSCHAYTFLGVRERVKSGVRPWSDTRPVRSDVSRTRG